MALCVRYTASMKGRLHCRINSAALAAYRAAADAARAIGLVESASETMRRAIEARTIELRRDVQAIKQARAAREGQAS